MADKLLANQKLTPNTSITSPDGRYSLILQDDGNLVLYGPGHQTVWQTGTHSGRSALMQGDGNFVLYGPSGALWNSHTENHPGASLVLLNDGIFAVYDVGGHRIWQLHPDHGLMPNIGLRTNELITSPDGRYSLILQDDGNLVLYGPGRRAVWHTATQSGQSALMQGDGNFVLSGPSGALWSSRTENHPGASLVLPNDGNLAVYDADGHPLWQVHPGHGLIPNTGLIPGESITSPDGRYSLILQSDGNLVLSGPGNQTVWQTGTNSGRSAVMQGDGNFVLVGPTGALWNSRTANHPGASLALQNNGRLVIQATNGQALWSVGQQAQHAAVPVFSYNDTEWNKLLQTTSDVATLLVLDIDIYIPGRPDVAPHFELARRRVAEAHQRGFRVLGYVPSFGFNPNRGPVSRVPQMVEQWYAPSGCPAIDGIFFDIGPADYVLQHRADTDAQAQAFYRNLYAQVKSKNVNATVMLNVAGIEENNRWIMEEPRTCDIALLVESFAQTHPDPDNPSHMLIGYTDSRFFIPSWAKAYPKERIAHTIYDCPATLLPQVVELGRNRGAGWMFIVEGRAQGYDHVPTYWDEELQLIGAD